jgi:3-phosphoshikimate 1-carboxyvinyltransferase
VRFGCCLALVCGGELLLDGEPRMRQRPLGPLVHALNQLGVGVRHLGEPDCLPVALKRGSAPAGCVSVDTSGSSQHASGLVLVAPRLPSGLTLELPGPIVSRPYLDMTITMARRAGAVVRWQADRIRVEPGSYRCGRIAVERDWSAAAFLLAAGELSATPVSIEQLEPPDRSIQGDASFAGLLAELRQPPHSAGRYRFDLGPTPDLIAPLAALALFASAPTALRGVAHARTKESDRIAVLCRELRKTGASITETADGLEIEPLRSAPPHSIAFNPNADHRMAMAFGLLTLRLPGAVVEQPDCVSKSFPAFWEQLARIRQG